MVHMRIIIDKIKLISGLNQKEIASQLFDITDRNLSNRIRRNSLDTQSIISWATNNNVDLNWLFSDSNIEHTNFKSTAQVDPEILTPIIEWVEELVIERNLNVTPKRKAKLIQVAYDYFSDPDHKINKKTLDSFIQLVA